MTTSEEEIIFHLSKEEFFFLTQMLDINYIAGFGDPFQGYLMEELEEEYQKVRQGLMDRGFLIPIEGSEELEMDELLGICLTCCGSDTAVFLKKNDHEIGDYEAFLHFTPNLVVERTPEGNGIALTPVANAELTMNILARFLPLTVSSEKLIHIILDEMNINAWDALSSQDKRGLLKAREIDLDVTADILSVETEPERLATMSFWSRYGIGWETESYRYSKRGSDLLLITEPDEKKLCIREYRPEPVLTALEQLAAKFDLVNEGA